MWGKGVTKQSRQGAVQKCRVRKTALAAPDRLSYGGYVGLRKHLQFPAELASCIEMKSSFSNTVMASATMKPSY